MTNNQKWYNTYFRLLAYYEQHGNIDLKISYKTRDGVKLGRWLAIQKSAYRKGTLSEERIKQLEKLNIKWHTREDNWLEMYNILKAYYENNGHSNMQTRYEGKNGLKIGSWLHIQRKAYYGNTTAKITKERIARLNKIDFDWSMSDTAFLNKEITNNSEYKKVMLERMKHILEDLSYEIDGNITSLEKQNAISKEIVKRMWK